MDHKLYKYIPNATNPRLLTEANISEATPKDAWAEGPTRRLAERVLLKFPKWQCVRGYKFSALTFYLGTEKLGVVYARYTEFELTNSRICATRERRGGMKTRDADRAFKLVCKYFKPTNSKERFTKAASDAGTWISTEVQTTQSMFRSKFHTVTYAARAYIMQDLPTYLDAAESNGLDKSKYADVVDLYSRSKQAALLNGYMQKDLGSIVKREGSGYLVGNPEGTEVFSLDDTTLPSAMRLALGKLKLVEPRTLVEGAGFRLDEDTFYVVVQ
jgi:hypothetical protein